MGQPFRCIDTWSVFCDDIQHYGLAMCNFHGDERAVFFPTQRCNVDCFWTFLTIAVGAIVSGQRSGLVLLRCF